MEELNELEKYYVDLYQTFNSNFGLNLRDGGGSIGKFSEETKKKMSDYRKGRAFSEQHKINISNSKKGHKNPMFGKPQSEETKSKKRGRKWKHTPETIANMKGKQRSLGYKHTEECKKRMAIKRTGIYHWAYGKKMKEETKLKISISKKGYVATDESKNKMRESAKKAWVERKEMKNEFIN